MKELEEKLNKDHEQYLLENQAEIKEMTDKLEEAKMNTEEELITLPYKITID